MTINTYILPMSETRHIIFIVYEGFELLDVSGPAAVFSTSNEVGGNAGYVVILAAPKGSQIKDSNGITLRTECLESLEFGRHDTVLVAGAYEKYLRKAMKDAQIMKSLIAASGKAERYGSICSGAFVIASTGLLKGRKVTTHWSGCRQLGTLFPDIKVTTDTLYVRDGNLWTSAGVTAGIDMALAMVEADYGSSLKAKVAKQLVVYSHRPGYQSQFSDLLMAQVKSDERFSNLINWLQARINQSVKVSDMADYMSMSERSFYRKFTEAFEQTPSRFFEQLRLNDSKRLIEAGMPINEVAGRVGFKSQSAFRTAFKLEYGITPTQHARMHN